ncbi:hypothetical protein BDV95DRAFT_491077 [Massariosphaeria phaeospora]|uniref:Uncharacterized protein n=1 Tax=Massariosphaeria phaeospora TaxID=100035 RepID=A0A7C8MBN9_9PLEO|nr:hypothetical protein BDV95DRAFT_491077 [Massariosphaeria phaeospora]
MLDCMLDRTRESIKGDVASGIVALGLLPTILTFIGCSTPETALLGRRRPLLAFLIAAGAPAVNPLRTFEYVDPLRLLRTHESVVRVPMAAWWQAALVSGAEYALVGAAAVNVSLACWQTGAWTVNTISCDDVYYPLLWAALAVVIHLHGIVALALRVVADPERRGCVNKMARWLRHEFMPCSTQDKVVLQRVPETYFFLVLSGWVSVGTVAHILYGTVAFSSLQFIGYVDSVRIIGRLLASTVVCRAVLRFELAGMRNAMEAAPHCGASSVGRHASDGGAHKD